MDIIDNILWLDITFSESVSPIYISDLMKFKEFAFRGKQPLDSSTLPTHVARLSSRSFGQLTKIRVSL